MNDTFQTKSGHTLHLKPLRRDAIMPILEKFGGPSMVQNSDALRNLSGRALDRANAATVQLFNYCAGWGVEDDPPSEMLDVMSNTGFGSDEPYLARINWVRYFALGDEDEAGAFIGAVLTYSTQQWAQAEQPVQPEPPQAEPETDALRAYVAELEARLAQTHKLQAQLDELEARMTEQDGSGETGA